MTKLNSVRCDSCQRTKGLDESTDHIWINVSTAVSAEEYATLVSKIHEGMRAEDVLDNGDFCSLECLANWASARASLRDLDRELDV